MNVSYPSEIDGEQSTKNMSSDVSDALETSSDLVRTYLNGIGKTALLSHTEEIQLAQDIEVGLYAQHILTQISAGEETEFNDRISDLKLIAHTGQKARNRLLEANLRLVVSLAKRYSGRGIALLDLVQEGNLGLIRAVEKFDYVKGFKFSTYATWWIRQAISRGMADQGRTIRLPVHLVEQINKITRIKREMYQSLGREATCEELENLTGLSARKVNTLLEYGKDPVSLDMPVGNEEDISLGEFIHDGESESAESTVINLILHKDINKVLATLDDREQQVIKLRYGFDNGETHTLDQIGKMFSLSRERVRQIERESIAKLRQGNRSDALRCYAS